MRPLQFLTVAAAFGVSVSFSIAQEPHPSLTTLYNGGSYGSLIFGQHGALFGTGEGGTVFELIPPPSPGGTWTEAVLHTFTGQNGDGFAPSGSPVRSASATLYGTTQEGGTANLGTVYELVPPASPGAPWTEAVLYSFMGGSDGSYPYTSLIIGPTGALYGTTAVGGDGGTPVGCNGLGCGTVFELAPPASPGGTWTETVLYSFTGGVDGSGPSASLVIGTQGQLYGTTEYGGAESDGTVFELAPPASQGDAWTETVLYAFTGQSGDGINPRAGLVIGSNGALYGTTLSGGTSGVGTVFELTPPASPGDVWTETVLYSFVGGSGGSEPMGGVVINQAGVLYGTTLNYGASTTCPGLDCGTVYALKPPASPGAAWTEIVLHNFAGGKDGAGPWATVVIGNSGALYGTTTVDGPAHAGTVFEVTP
jgi:uncharacterized repeat protein (TIGR03803 family)